MHEIQGNVTLEMYMTIMDHADELYDKYGNDWRYQAGRVLGAEFETQPATLFPDDREGIAVLQLVEKYGCIYEDVLGYIWF